MQNHPYDLSCDHNDGSVVHAITSQIARPPATNQMIWTSVSHYFC